MRNENNGAAYEVVVTIVSYDLDKNGNIQVVGTYKSKIEAFNKVAKVAKEVYRDGFNPYGSALFAIGFENNALNDAKYVDIRVRDAETGKFCPISYGIVGMYINQELFTKLLNDYVENIKNIAGKE